MSAASSTRAEWLSTSVRIASSNLAELVSANHNSDRKEGVSALMEAKDTAFAGFTTAADEDLAEFLAAI
jgi:hypothetical protein